MFDTERSADGRRGDAGAGPLPFQDVLRPSEGVVAVEIVSPVDVAIGEGA
jgi:hypothetical protein